MRNLYVLIFLIEVVFVSQSQNIQNFENGFYSDWGTNTNTTNNTDSIFSIVDNPYKTLLNITNKSAKMIRYISGDWKYGWFNFNPITIPENISHDKYLHILVLRELNMDTATNELVNLIDSLQMELNVWKDYVYRISTSGVFSRIEFNPNVNNTSLIGLANEIIYIDEIVIDDNPLPRVYETNLEETDINDIKVFVKDKMLKLFNLNGKLSLAVFSLDGISVFKQEFEDRCYYQDVDLSFVSPGVYIVLLKRKDKLLIHKILL